MPDKSAPEDKTFKLTPYPSQQKGQEQIRSGIFSMSLSIFLLLTVADGDWFTVTLAVFFLFVASQLILAGSALKRLPERSRSVRVGPSGLFKMIEGSDVARLPLRRIRAIWKSDDEPSLWLCTKKGVQRFTPDELRDPREWSSFVTHLERSLSHSLWELSEDMWRAVQDNSHRMKRYTSAPSHITRSLISITALSIPVGAAFVTLSGVTLEQLLSGYPEVSFMLLGGSASWLNAGGEWGRAVVGPWMHFDLIQLSLTCLVYWWTARSLGRIVGAKRVMTLVLIAHILSAAAHQLSGDYFPLLGAFAPQVALMFSLWRLLRSQPPGMELALGTSRTALLWLSFAHILIISVFPDQAMNMILIDLIVGVALGWLSTRLWSLSAPLWRLQLPNSLSLSVMFGLSSLITLGGFVSYGSSLRRPTSERLSVLIASAPERPSWTAQLASMCSAGPCLAEDRAQLMERLERDTQGSPITPDCHPQTLQTHLSQLRLSLTQDLQTGSLSPRSISLATSRAAVSPNAPFATLLLSALSPQGGGPELALPSALSTDHIQRRPLSLTSPLKLKLEGASGSWELQFSALREERGWRLAWSSLGAELDAPLTSGERAWLLIGEGVGKEAKPLALLALPAQATQATEERDQSLRFHSAAGDQQTRSQEALKPWVKVLEYAPQPSAAKSQRLLLWRAQDRSAP